MSGDGHAHIIVFDKPNSLESWMPRVSMTARESSTATLRALLATMEIELQANPNVCDHSGGMVNVTDMRTAA
jgi:hypothetical protein